MYKKFVLSCLLLASLVLTTFSQKLAKKGYQINGTVTGFPDSTRIYLADPMSGTPIPIDSALIIKDRFHLHGSLAVDAMSVILQVDDEDREHNHYKYFWLENADIGIKAEKGNLHEAVITGSATEREQHLLDSALEKSDGRITDKKIGILFIRHHPNSLVSANVLSIYATTWGKDTVAPLYNRFSAKVKNSVYGKNIKTFIELNKEVNVGDHFTDFAQMNPEGKNIRLSDYKGKIVLLEFWGSGCGPCREGNPELIGYYNEFKDRGFDILGVTLDGSKKNWTDAVRDDKIPWQTVSDLNGWQNKVALQYGVGSMPTSFLIDANGVVIAKNLRGADLRNKLLEVVK